MIFEEKQISSQLIYEGKILNVRRDKVTAKKGESTREIVEHNGAVAMVAITDENHVLLVKQYRYACHDAVLEIPAGKIDREETGYTAEHVHYLGKINPSVGYSEEVIYLYAMTDLTPGEQDLDEDEALDVLEYPFEEAYQMAARGEMIDAKTIAALMMAKEQLGEELLP